MDSISGDYHQLCLSLSEAIKDFIGELEKHNLSDMATDKWTVKDELCHIAFWHNYYAQNYASLAAGTKPFVFSSKGGSARNQEGVDKFKDKSKKDLIAIINKAQSGLYESIVIKKVPEMTYIEGRKYKTEDFLTMITGHIQRHTLHVKKAKKIKPRGLLS